MWGGPLWWVGVRRAGGLAVWVRLRVACARGGHGCEVGVCDRECALHAGALEEPMCVFG